jgi:hypothetical protein
VNRVHPPEPSWPLQSCPVTRRLGVTKRRAHTLGPDCERQDSPNA